MWTDSESVHFRGSNHTEPTEIKNSKKRGFLRCHSRHIGELLWVRNLVRFSNPQFALLIVFSLLFAGSAFLFENIDILYGTLYAVKVIVT
jgi:hypothetical protein